MGWIFRKGFRIGPFRGILSKKGIGMSWGFPGFRFGVSPNGKRYISLGLPGTGLYWIKYLTDKNTGNPPQTQPTQLPPAPLPPSNNNQQPWWKNNNP